MDSISVAMATYNGARYIREQLDSLAAQTRLPSELVVTDDGSTDGTLDILAAFAGTAPFAVRVQVNPQRLGYAANFMRCASLCEGTLIAFCDQDDVWHPDKLDACAAGFAPGVHLVYHNADIVERDRVLRPLYPVSDRSSVRPFGRSPWFVALGFTIVFRRRLLAFGEIWERSIGYGNDARLAHDQWISLLGNICGPVVYLPQALARYRMHDNNVTLKQTSMLGELRYNIGRSQARAESCAAVLARVSALIGDEARAGRPSRQTATLLDEASHELAETASWMKARAALYGRAGFFRNAAVVTRLLTTGAYGARATGGLGIRVLLKDCLVGCLMMPLLTHET